MVEKEEGGGKKIGERGRRGSKRVKDSPRAWTVIAMLVDSFYNKCGHLWRIQCAAALSSMLADSAVANIEEAV